MRYLYVDFPIYNPLAFELVKWMNEKNKDRIKASKMLKLVEKYEKIYKKPKLNYNEVARPPYNLNVLKPNYKPQSFKIGD